MAKGKEVGPETIPNNTSFEIVGLEAENIKALKAVKLGLKGHSLVIVGGNNAQGKTSLLDSIAIALGGKKQEPEEVIRRGENHGRIVLDLDEAYPLCGDTPIELKVTVVFTKKAGRKLILEGKDGSTFRSPQEIFDRFINRLTFDPLEFVRLDKEKQVGIVREMSGIDFTQLDQEYQVLYDERRDLNRDLKGAEGAVAQSISGTEDLQLKPVDVPSLIAQRDQIQEGNAKNNDRMRKIEQLKKDLQLKAWTKNDIIEQIQTLQSKLEVVEKEISEMERKEKEWEGLSKSLVWHKTDEIDLQISQAQEINSLIEKKKFRDEQLTKVTAIRKQVADIEGNMESIKEQKARMLSQAHYPVPGFRIDADGCLLYNDLPFSQASSMQQIDVAIDMALAINPHLKLALVREGSIIDLDNLKRIHQKVEAMGGKLIMERTGKGDEMSVIIEEGEIIENRLESPGEL